MRIPGGGASESLAGDVRDAQELRGQFKSDPKAALHGAAQQFEALFLQMMLKSMRATTGQDSLVDSDASRFFTEMLDQQTAKNLSQTGTVGLAQALEAQLARRLSPDGTASGEAPARSAGSVQVRGTHGLAGQIAALAQRSAALAGTAKLAGDDGTAGGNAATAQTPRDFVNQIWPYAVEASRSTGIPPQFLVAHAALESGWGKRDIRNADGSPSYNLFGIKAGKSWSGKRTEVLTTEYQDGVPSQQKEAFRSYGSYAEAFQDYAQLLRSNPRYGAVIGSQDGTEFARSLQQAGYASDPKYAEKLAAIINGSTLSQALIG
jgi:flagellar protein FlgJ